MMAKREGTARELKSIYARVIGPSLFFEPHVKLTTHPNSILVEMGLNLEFLWNLVKLILIYFLDMKIILNSVTFVLLV